MRRPASVTVASAFTILGGAAEGLVASLALALWSGEGSPVSKHPGDIWLLPLALAASALGMMGVWGARSARKGRRPTILLTVAGIHLTLGLGALVALGVLLVTTPKSLIYVVVFSVLTMVPVAFETAAIIAIRSPASSDFFRRQHGLTSGAEPLDTEVISQRAPNPTCKMRCAKCRYVQPVPLDLPLFVCEGCGARMKRRRSPSPKQRIGPHQEERGAAP
jgi:hypothetical protein